MIGVENLVLLKILQHQRFQASQLDLVVHLALQLLLVARHTGLPAFNSRVEFQKRTTSQRSDCAKNIPLPSSGGEVISFLQSSPRLQWVLPRLGNNVVRLLTRESHKRCMHLLQNVLQVLYSSLLVRLRRQKFTVDECCRVFVVCSAAHSNIISDSLITPAKNASIFSDHERQPTHRHHDELI